MPQEQMRPNREEKDFEEEEEEVEEEKDIEEEEDEDLDDLIDEALENTEGLLQNYRQTGGE